MPKIHFSGIGGTAMVAGARLAIEAGWEVRGSDTPLYPPASHMVEALGVPVAYGYDAANLDWGPDAVIIGNALSRGNPEVEATLSRHLRYISLPEWLKENVLRARRPVAICGTHGKTTTTALTAHILDKGISGVGYLVGGETLGFAHSSRLGHPDAPFVIEGDEYDTAFFDKRAKFLHYLPEIAVVTSMEFDHGDIYKDIDEIETAFQRMLRQIPREGTVFLCADNYAASLASHAYSNVATYGFSEDATWRGVYKADERFLEIYNGKRYWGRVQPSLAGKHNMSNTLAAVAVAATVGISSETIAAAVADFPGVRRRMEVFLEHRGIRFVDDFAHHPTAIRETIAGARLKWPKCRIRAIFEPRSNTTVTNKFQKDLEIAFYEADTVMLGPIHRKEKIPESERLDTVALAASLTKKNIESHAFDNIPEIVDALFPTLEEGDVVLIMSNGAFGGIYNLFRARIENS